MNHRGEHGSVSLESTLLVALLILVASFTLLSLGDAIACLYAREAAMASRIGFWATVPEVAVSGQEPGTVSWSTEGQEGPYTVLLARPGTPGLDMEDHATWARLGTYDAPPVTGLDIQPGDTVVVAARVERCGYALIGPAWPAGDGTTIPGGSHDGYDGGAWYAASFLAADDAAGTNARHWLAAYDADGTQLWAIPSALGEHGPAVPSRVGVSDDNLYAFLRPMVDLGAGPVLGEGGIYAFHDWRGTHPGEPELLVPPAVFDDGVAYALDLDSFHVSSDGWQMLVAGTRDTDGQRRLLLVNLETLGITDTGIAAGPLTTGVFGRDGNAYAVDGSGAARRLSGSGGAVVAAGIPAGYVLEHVGPSGDLYLYDATAGTGSVLSVAGGTVSVAGSTAEGVNFRAPAADPDGAAAVLDGSRSSRLDALRLAADATGTNVSDTLLDTDTDAGPVVEGLALASIQGPAVLWDTGGVPPPPAVSPGDFTYEILVNGTVVYSETFTPTDPSSVLVNGIVPENDVPLYARDAGTTWVLPSMRATTHRTLGGGGRSRSDYAEINAPGGLPGSTSSMSNPWSNFGEIQRPGSWLAYRLHLSPDGETGSDGWAGLHAPAAGLWARSVEHNAGHAIAIGKDGSTLAKSLCISLPSLADNRAAELGGFPSRTYRVTAGASLDIAGEKDPSRLLAIVYPMLPSGTGWAVPDVSAGTRMADMSLQVAGLSWDRGAGRIPDSYLSYFASDPSFPVPAVGNEGLLMMDTGIAGVHTDDTVLSRATRLKRSAIEVRVTGGTVYPQVVAKTNTAPIASLAAVRANDPSSSSDSISLLLTPWDADGDTVTMQYGFSSASDLMPSSWLTPSSSDGRGATTSYPYPYTHATATSTAVNGSQRYAHVRVRDGSHVAYRYTVVPIPPLAPNQPPEASVSSIAYVKQPASTADRLDIIFDLSDPDGDQVRGTWVSSTNPDANLTSYLWTSTGSWGLPPDEPVLKTASVLPGTTYYVRYQITDRKGNTTGIATIPIAIPPNAPPEMTVTTQVTQRPDQPTDRVDVSFEMYDPDGDNVTATWIWTTDPAAAIGWSALWTASGTYGQPPAEPLVKTVYGNPGTTHYLGYRLTDRKGNATGTVLIPIAIPAR